MDYFGAIASFCLGIRSASREEIENQLGPDSFGPTAKVAGLFSIVLAVGVASLKLKAVVESTDEKSIAAFLIGVATVGVLFCILTRILLRMAGRFPKDVDIADCFLLYALPWLTIAIAVVTLVFDTFVLVVTPMLCVVLGCTSSGAQLAKMDTDENVKTSRRWRWVYAFTTFLVGVGLTVAVAAFLYFVVLRPDAPTKPPNGPVP